MGSSQSTINQAEEERRRKAEAERLGQLQRAQEEERHRRQQDELRKEEQKLKEEMERKRKEEAELERKRVEEKERESKLLEYKHVEEMQKIKDLEEGNQRKDNLTEKEYQLEHERLMQGQEQMFAILKGTFEKVKDVDISQAVFSAYILQCIQSGKPIDKVVLEAVASKVPTPPPPNLEQIVENVIHQCEEDGYESSYKGRCSTGEIARSRDNEL